MSENNTDIVSVEDDNRRNSDPELIKARIMVAQHESTRRNTESIKNRIVENFADKDFRETAIYSLPRKSKGKTFYITGLSIGAVKELALIYGHLDFGIKVLRQTATAADVKAYALDLQNNVSEERVFKVSIPQDRFTRKPLSSEEAYKKIYAESVKRMRACILHCIPESLQNHTINILKIPSDSTLLLSYDDRLNKALLKFQELDSSFTKEDMLKKLDKTTADTLTADDFTTLLGIFNSIKDGFFKNKDSDKDNDKEKTQTDDAFKIQASDGQQKSIKEVLKEEISKNKALYNKIPQAKKEEKQK